MIGAHRTRFCLVLIAVVIGAPVHDASAQESDPASAARMRIGPVGLTPTMSVSGGFDDNVFNQEDDPKEDYVLYINPQLQTWVRARRLTVSLHTIAPVAHFHEYSDQSSAGIRSEVQVDVNMNRFKPYVTSSYVNSQERTSPEIDTRPRRRERIIGAGTNIGLLSRMVLTVGGNYSESGFAEDAVFESVNLAQALNRKGQTVTLALRYPLTSLTRLVLTAERLTERFEFQASRDSDTIRFLPGVELDALALIRGRAAVGYRKFNIINAESPDFAGLVAHADVSSSPWSTGLLSASVRRDVSYSFEPQYPYFVLNGVGASVTQVIRERWRLMAHGDRQELDYRQLNFSAAGQEPRNPDLVYSYGAGLQFQLRPRLGVRVAFDSSRRVSGLARRRYEGTRIFTSLSYGP